MKDRIKSGRAYRNAVLIFATLVTAFSPLFPLYNAPNASAASTYVTDLASDGWFGLDNAATNASLVIGGVNFNSTSTGMANLFKRVDIPLSSITESTFDEILAVSGTPIKTSVQLELNFDGGKWGRLVVENDYKNNVNGGVITGWHVSPSAANAALQAIAPRNTCSGNGSVYCGSLSEFQSVPALSDATVTYIGMKIGSGIYADNTVSTLTLAGTRYVFGIPDTQAPVMNRFNADGKTTIGSEQYYRSVASASVRVTDDRGITLLTLDGVDTGRTCSGNCGIDMGYDVYTRGASEGKHTIRAYDAFNNELVYDYYVDKTAPEFSITINGGTMPLDGSGNYSNRGDLDIVITAADPLLADGSNGSGTQLVYLANGATYSVSPTTVYGNQLSFTIPAGTLSDGVHTLSLIAYDNAGNITNNNYATDYTFNTDSTLPTLQIKPSPDSNKATNPLTGIDWYNKISFKASDASGFQAFDLNGNLRNDPKGPGGWSDWNWQNITRSWIKEGKNTIAAIDKSGNRTELEFNFDSTAPVIVIGGFTGTKDENIYSDLQINFHDTLSGLGKVEIQDEGGVVVWERAQNGETFSNIDGIGSRSYYGLASGKYTVIVYDILGNSAQYSFELDLLPPTITINGAAPKAVYNIADGDLRIKATDQPTNLNLSHCVVNGTEFGRDYNKSSGLDVNALMSGWSLYREGENTITCYDKAGNFTTATFIIDRIAPEVAINVLPTMLVGKEANGYYNYATATLRSTATDLDYIKYTINGGTATRYTRAINILADTKLCATAVDIHGNRGAEVCETILIDREAPTAIAEIDPSTWTSGPVTVTINAVDAKSGIPTNACIFASNRFELAIAVITGTGWTTCETTVDSNNTVYYAVRDNLGNIATGSTRVANIDASAPIVTIDELDSDCLCGTVTFTGTATDDESGLSRVLFVIDNQSYTITDIDAEGNWTYTVDTTKLTAGNHNFGAYAENNVSPAAYTYSTILTYMVDNQRPSVKVTSPAANEINSGIFTITGTATDANLNRVEIYVGTNDQNGVFKGYVHNKALATVNPDGSFSFDVDLPALPAGWTYYVRAYAYDDCGNNQSAGFNGIIVDKSAPVVTIDELDGNCCGTVTFTGTAYDKESGLIPSRALFIVDWTVHGVITDIDAEGNWTYTIDTKTLSTGSHEFTAYAENNVTPSPLYTYSETLAYTVDNQRPTVKVISPITDETNNGIFTITGTATDNVAVTEFYIYVGLRDENGVFKGYTFNKVPTTLEADGSFTFDVELDELPAGWTYYVRAYAYDACGNSHSAGADGIIVEIEEEEEGGSGNGGQGEEDAFDNGETVSTTTRDWTYAYDDGQDVLGDTDDTTGDINGEENNQTVAGDTDENEEDGSAADSWALLNLLMAILTALIAVGAMIRRSAKENSALRTGTIVVAFVAIVAFIVTQNMTLPMTFVDNWSILMVALAVINVGLIAGLIKSSDKDEDKK